MNKIAEATAALIENPKPNIGIVIMIGFGIVMAVVLVFSQHFSYAQRFDNVDHRVSVNEKNIERVDTKMQRNQERTHQIELTLQELQSDSKYIIKTLDSMNKQAKKE